MKRRQFLRALIGTSWAASALFLGNPFWPRFRVAQAATGKTLVVVFQRGGCDGLNTVVPYAEDEYYRLRPSIAIAPPSATDPESAIDLDGFFGLHPALAAFEAIYQCGDLAILPTVHYPNAARSHFDSARFIESAAISKERDGWLNRHLASQPADASLRAVGVGTTLPHALRGSATVSVFGNLNDFNLGVSGDTEPALLVDLAQVYNQTPDTARSYRERVHHSGQIMLKDRNILRNLDVTGQTPANGAEYPDSRLGRQMMQTALLIKQGVGLEVAALSMGGWDTHSDQGSGNADGHQSRLFDNFARSIAAFDTDLGERMNDVLVLTITEFGRTAKENASLGTDHGNASTWFAIGRGVTGGIYLRDGWPGLTEEQLYRTRYLRHTIDYRDVFGEVLTRHLSNFQLDRLLPGHPYTPIGFLLG